VLDLANAVAARVKAGLMAAILETGPTK